jgi:hypothetical protein
MTRFFEVSPTMLPPFDLPEGILVLITDQLHSPADFLLHRSLIGHIKTSKTSKSVILSVSEGIARWKAIAAKSVRPLISPFIIIGG